jgi:hypothetical protein
MAGPNETQQARVAVPSLADIPLLARLTHSLRSSR